MEALLDDAIGVGALVAQGAALFLLAGIFAPMPRLRALIGRHGALLGFLLSLCAGVGTLYYSEVVGLTPCALCWYQRVLLYPQILLFACAIFKKDRRIFLATLVLSVLGFLVALYHISLPMWVSPIFCDPETELCLVQYVKVFGYITIPVMSASVFAVLLVLSVHGYRTSSRDIMETGAKRLIS